MPCQDRVAEYAPVPVKPASLRDTMFDELEIEHADPRGEMLGFDLGGFFHDVIHSIHKVVGAIGKAALPMVRMIPGIGNTAAGAIEGSMTVLDAIDQGDDKAKEQVVATSAAAQAGDPQAKVAMQALAIASAQTIAKNPNGPAATLIGPLVSAYVQASPQTVHGDAPVLKDVLNAFNHLRRLANQPTVGTSGYEWSKFHASPNSAQVQAAQNAARQAQVQAAQNAAQQAQVQAAQNAAQQAQVQAAQNAAQQAPAAPAAQAIQNTEQIATQTAQAAAQPQVSAPSAYSPAYGGGGGGGYDDDDDQGDDDMDEELDGEFPRRDEVGAAKRKNPTKAQIVASPDAKHTTAAAVHLIQTIKKGGKPARAAQQSLAYLKKGVAHGDKNAKAALNMIKHANAKLKGKSRLIMGADGEVCGSLYEGGQVVGFSFGDIFHAVLDVFGDILTDPLKYLLPGIGPIFHDLITGQPIDLVSIFVPGGHSMLKDIGVEPKDADDPGPDEVGAAKRKNPTKAQIVASPDAKHTTAAAVHLIQTIKKGGKPARAAQQSLAYLKKGVAHGDKNAKAALNMIKHANAKLKGKSRLIMGADGEVCGSLYEGGQVVGFSFGDIFHAVLDVFGDILTDPLKYLLPGIGPIFHDLITGQPIDLVSIFVPGGHSMLKDISVEPKDADDPGPDAEAPGQDPGVTAPAGVPQQGGGSDDGGYDDAPPPRRHPRKHVRRPVDETETDDYGDEDSDDSD